MGEIGTGTNIHPKANMGDAIDNDKGDRDSDMCRQRQSIASPPRLASPLSIATISTIDLLKNAIFNVAEMGTLTEAYAPMYRCPYPRCTLYPIKYTKIHLKYISYTQGIGASVHRPPVRGVDVHFRNEAPMLNDRAKRYLYIAYHIRNTRERCYR